MKKTVFSFLFAAGFFCASVLMVNLSGGSAVLPAEAMDLPYYESDYPGANVLPGTLYGNSAVIAPSTEEDILPSPEDVSAADMPGEIPAVDMPGEIPAVDMPGDTSAPDTSADVPADDTPRDIPDDSVPENIPDVPAPDISPEPVTEIESAAGPDILFATEPETVSVRFERINIYWMNQFEDVAANSWCADYVRIAYEYGIMTGRTDRYFDTAGSLTVGQGIAMACRMHGGYDGERLCLDASNPWYRTYVDYALSHGILDPGVDIRDYNQPISRAGFAALLSGAIPESALPEVNEITDGAIPDLSPDARCYDAVYRLYRAGILTGSDASGTFSPQSNISRGAAAAVVSRMAEPRLRQSITLTG